MLTNLEETATFIIHAIKQFCFGFELMDELSDNFTEGRAGITFFLSAIYQQLSVFYLIDKKDRPMGGAFYPALKKYGYENLLQPIKDLLDTPLGTITFGEVVRVFRNKALVHTQFLDSDLDLIYKQIDMNKPESLKLWQELLLNAYKETKLLAIRVAEATGRPLSDFGIIDTSL